jgi:cell division protein FtsB
MCGEQIVMMDIEAVGALATAGLISHEIDGVSKPAADHGHACANCHTPLNGAFCHSCGQSAHIHHSLLHLVEEVLHGIWHFDAKGWRTIPVLLFMPGKLTRLYIDGQRMRYLSPLALFLFMIFFMFFVFSWTGGEEKSHTDPALRTKERAALVKELEEARTEIATIEAALKNHKDNVDKIDLNAAIIDFKIAEKALSQFDAEFKGNHAADQLVALKISGEDVNGKKIDTGYALLYLAMSHAINNPDLAICKI